MSEHVSLVLCPSLLLLVYICFFISFLTCFMSQLFIRTVGLVLRSVSTVNDVIYDIIGSIIIRDLERVYNYTMLVIILIFVIEMFSDIQNMLRFVKTRIMSGHTTVLIDFNPYLDLFIHIVCLRLSQCLLAVYTSGRPKFRATFV